uniref:Uncharacterized protein n=1 Tax=Arundo donax TaxID=35708 RepID=A0A0A8Y4G3_ARUDO
MTWSSTKFCC